MKYNVILFDLDETLLDFHGAQKQCIAKLFTELCNSPKGVDPEDFYWTYRKINSDLWKQLEQGKIKKEKLRVERFQRTFDYYEIDVSSAEANDFFIRELSQTVCLIPGAVEVLEQLKGKAQMAIITNGFKEVQYSRMEKVGLTQYFDAIVTSDEVGAAKPQSKIFEEVFSRLESPDKMRSLVIGDKISADILGGQNFGITTCWFNHENQENETPEIRPDYEINHIKELIEIVC